MAFVKPHKTDNYDFAQSKHEQLPTIPFRAIVAAPSGTGKTVLLQSMVLELYRTKSGKTPFCSRIYIWSPSVNVDPAWKPVNKFIREELGVDEDKEQFCYDAYVPEELADVIKTQKHRRSAREARREALVLQFEHC